MNLKLHFFPICSYPPPEIAQKCSYPPPGVGTENSISRAAFLNFLLPNLCMGRVLRERVPDTLMPRVHSTSAELLVKKFQSAPIPPLELLKKVLLSPP